jgi:hypothetical protein
LAAESGIDDARRGLSGSTVYGVASELELGGFDERLTRCIALACIEDSAAVDCFVNSIVCAGRLDIAATDANAWHVAGNVKLKIFNSNSRRCWLGCLPALLIASLVITEPTLTFADGGTLRLSQRCGDYQVSIFTSPATLRCGLIDISVLVQNLSDRKTRNDIPLMIRLVQANGDQPLNTLEQPATVAAATNKLMRAAVFEISKPGIWQGNILLNTDSETAVATNTVTKQEAASVAVAIENKAVSLNFELVISPPLPGWFELVPWIGWPFGAMALFLVHQGLASGSERKRMKIC